MSKILHFKTLVFLLLSLHVFSQSNDFFYATVPADKAAELQQLFPSEVDILATKNSQSAVYMSRFAAKELHQNVTTHGPGYVFMDSGEKALQRLEMEILQSKSPAMAFTITEDVMVQEGLNLINATNIEDHILLLEGYGTRFHTKPTATIAIMDLKDKWEAMAATAGRTDVSVRIVDHVNTPMPSVVMTIEGAETPDEFVIIGGHADSTANPNNDDAPGADDDASGIATITEVARALFELEYYPSKTIEFMAFAAEEIGLVGSGEIADEYNDNNINVIAFVQFDMTLYPGSAEDVFITTDSYNSNVLNDFLTDLMDHYNASGPHQFTYSTTACGYGCSDHYSWSQEGYETAFPFESDFSESNPFIHSPDDTYDFVGNPDHAKNFAKLGLEFLIEATKSAELSTEDFTEAAVGLFIRDKTVSFQLKNGATALKNLSIFDVAGQKVVEKPVSGNKGTISLQQLAQGFYIARFTLANNRTIAKKFVLR